MQFAMGQLDPPAIAGIRAFGNRRAKEGLLDGKKPFKVRA